MGIVGKRDEVSHHLSRVLVHGPLAQGIAWRDVGPQHMVDGGGWNILSRGLIKLCDGLTMSLFQHFLPQPSPGRRPVEVPKASFGLQHVR